VRRTVRWSFRFANPADIAGTDAFSTLAMTDLLQRGPLYRHRLVHGGSPQALRDRLINVLGASEVAVDDGVANFDTTLAYLPLKRLALVFSDMNAAMRIRLPAVGMVKQPIALGGRGTVSFGALGFDVNPEATGVIPAGVEMIHDNGPGLAQFVLRIDAAALQTKLSAVVGNAIVRNIEFETVGTFANPALRRLRRLLNFIVDELDSDDGEAPPTALDEYEEMLLLSFLIGNRHNFSTLLERTPQAPAPWQVRLVEEYIDANWNAPITVEALAAVTGGSARSIFKAFKEARGSTPMAYVKNVRLEHARRMLQAAEGEASVIRIAYTCGFLNSGHFARDYRTAYGELPSATLNKARRRRA
jgi:AraC-like DNA-binding protein